MQPAIKGLINYLKNFNIKFSPTDGKLDNVVFENDEKIIKIVHFVFYRFSGICKIQKSIKGRKNKIEFVDITDEMYINMFMKPLIQKKFNLI